MAILADLSAEFGWAPDAWRRLTWAELGEWIRELGRRREEEREAAEQARQQAETRQRATEFFRQHGIGG